MRWWLLFPFAFLNDRLKYNILADLIKIISKLLDNCRNTSISFVYYSFHNHLKVQIILLKFNLLIFTQRLSCKIDYYINFTNLNIHVFEVNTLIFVKEDDEYKQWDNISLKSFIRNVNIWFHFPVHWFPIVVFTQISFSSLIDLYNRY